MNQNYPRRIVHACPPGHLLKRAVLQPRAARLEVTGRDLPYLAAVRTLPCLRCGMEPSEAAHVRFASAAFGKASGLGRKPSDAHSVPLCSGCHRLDRDAQHARGEREFWDSIGINPLIVAERLHAQRGDLVAMRAVVMVAIAERGRFAAPAEDAPPAKTPPSSRSAAATCASPGPSGAPEDGGPKP